jgi:integrase
MKKNDTKVCRLNAPSAKPRSLPVDEWPAADRLSWEDACRPGIRLNPGGRASYLALVSRTDFAGRYGAFLGFVQRTGCLDHRAMSAAHVTPCNVEAYVADLNSRVRSVTVWNCVYKLRRAAELLDPTTNFSWLYEIERDLALVMVPRPKFDRVVLSERLADAGLTLVVEAEAYSKNAFDFAKDVRNGLMIALLAVCPIRIRNFAFLEIGLSFKKVQDSWWIAVPPESTKTGKPEERRIPEFLNLAIELYLDRAWPILIGKKPVTNALWISSRTGRQITAKNLGTLISKITLRTIGVDVSPHLFRTAGATTAAIYGNETPHLASALLGHDDPRVTHEHYNRTTSMHAAQIYGSIVEQYRNGEV